MKRGVAVPMVDRGSVIFPRPSAVSADRCEASYRALMDKGVPFEAVIIGPAERIRLVGPTNYPRSKELFG